GLGVAPDAGHVGVDQDPGALGAAAVDDQERVTLRQAADRLEVPRAELTVLVVDDRAEDCGGVTHRVVERGSAVAAEFGPDLTLSPTLTALLRRFPLTRSGPGK